MISRENSPVAADPSRALPTPLRWCGQLIRILVSPSRALARHPWMLRRVNDLESVVVWNTMFYATAAVSLLVLTDRAKPMASLAWVFGIVAVSRINELLIAFGGDALQQRRAGPRRLKNVGPTERIALLACSYLEVIAQFAVAHLCLAAQVGGAYKPDHLDWSAALYLSAVTITSTGFGDIVPVAWGARLLTAYEAVVGTIFVAFALGAYLNQRVD